MDPMTHVFTIGIIILALFFIVAYWVSAYREHKRFREEAKARLEQAESKVEQEPEKAKPAWDLARLTLEAHFTKNLSQIASIFWLSVIVMLAGFAMLLYGIWQSVQTPTLLGPATIASISGIITEFIGATFLFIYRSTIQQAINYSKTLERINSVGMAMQILDTMPDSAKATDLKSKTKAKLVELLVRKTAGAPETRLNDGRRKTSSEPPVENRGGRE
jgi:cbb3-type cytochrome oxidase subunit 3